MTVRAPRHPHPLPLLMPTPVEVGEPLSVGVAAYRSDHERATYLRAVRHFADGRLVVVLGLRDGAGLSAAELPDGVRLVVTAEPGAELPGDGAGCHEPDPFRAVVGAMAALRPGDGLLILLPADWAGPAAEFLVEQGRRWRAHPHAPEDGEFFPVDHAN